MEWLRGALLEWYRSSARVLPWRGTSDPYAVWVAEVMLQQTQVRTVIPYFERWMRRFPTVQALAEAPLDDVLRCWAGLGYYARARNLHAAAQVLVHRHGGRLPADRGALLALPGIGRYTAGAILSIAFDVPAPVLDGNVVRVLSRVFLVEGDPARGETRRRLWTLAEALAAGERPGDLNQALMELGAMVCTPEAPSCARCPVSAGCAARASGRTGDLPQLAPKADTIRVEHVSAVVWQAGRVLLVQRHADESLWAGLWELPRTERAEGESLADSARRAAREALGIEVCPGAAVAAIRHTVTRHRIRLHAVEAALIAGTPHPAGCAACAWVPLDEADDLPLSAPQTRLIRELRRLRPGLPPGSPPAG